MHGCDTDATCIEIDLDNLPSGDAAEQGEHLFLFKFWAHENFILNSSKYPGKNQPWYKKPEKWNRGFYDMNFLWNWREKSFKKYLRKYQSEYNLSKREKYSCKNFDKIFFLKIASSRIYSRFPNGYKKNSKNDRNPNSDIFWRLYYVAIHNFKKSVKMKYALITKT